MNINELKQSKYIKGTDVPKPALLTVKLVDVANVAREGEKADNKPVMHFREMDKPMVLNSTNLKRAAKAFGSDETDDWVGKKIVLYFDPDVEFGGEIVGGLRLRAPKGQQPEPEDLDVPF